MVTSRAALWNRKSRVRSARAERLAVDAHVVGLADVKGGAREHLAVDADAALGDPGFGVAARANARPRHDLGDALALVDSSEPSGFVFFAHGLAHPAAVPPPRCRERRLVLSPNAPGRQRKNA